MRKAIYDPSFWLGGVEASDIYKRIQVHMAKIVRV
jgi:hypothetical protein